MENKKLLIINMLASLALFAINIGIGLMLSPFVVSRLGAEAYGYVGLANNMISYASVLTIALDSVAGRFISVAYHRGEREKADKYFSSAFAADAAIALVVLAVAAPGILGLEGIINISPSLVSDVKLLFAFLTAQFVITSLSTVLTVATFITNRLYLSSLANVGMGVARVLVMVACFGFLPPMVAYVGLGALTGTILVALLNYAFTRRLTPELRFRRSAVSWLLVREMVSAGVWNVVIKLQQIISLGLKLLLANLLVSPYKMGMLSIAQTVPNMVTSLIYTVSGLFYPEQTRLFALGRTAELVSEVKSGMRVCGLLTVPIVVTSVFMGRDFFALWQPGQDSGLLYGLMVVVMGGFLVSGAAANLQNLPLIMNRLRVYSLSWLAFGALSLPATWLLLETTSLGIYAVALAPAFIESVANILFVPLYAAAILGVPHVTFYPVYGQYLASMAASALLCAGIRVLLGSQATWAGLLCSCAAYGATSLLACFLLMLGTGERTRLLAAIRSRLRI